MNYYSLECYSNAKAYWDVPPEWVTFSPKILRYGSHFIHKVPFHKKKKKKKKCEKVVKSTVFSGRKPFRMGSDLQNFQGKTSQISRFVLEEGGETPLEMGPNLRKLKKK